MRRYQRQIAYIIIVFIVAFTVFWLCRNGLIGHNHAESHAWLHKQLALTNGQEEKLTPIEARFHVNETKLVADIHNANQELATAITDGKTYSESVVKAVENIHHAQGELQKLTIEHFFEMQTVLTPEQIDKLNRLAADALVKNK